MKMVKKVMGFSRFIGLSNSIKSDQPVGRGVELARLGMGCLTMAVAMILTFHPVLASGQSVKDVRIENGIRVVGHGEILLEDRPVQPAQVMKQGVHSDQLVSREVVLGGNSGRKQIALTFDDGPDPKITAGILDVLKRYHIKATFFVVGENVESNPALIKRAIAEGHEIGNHTYSHPDFTRHSALEIWRELQKTEKMIGALTGLKTIYYRQPYNVDVIPELQNNIDVFRLARRNGYRLVGSLIDPRDWENPAPEELIQRVHHQLRKGHIILLHDIKTRSNTLQALPLLIESLKAKGYEFTTISGLRGQRAPRASVLDRWSYQCQIAMEGMVAKAGQQFGSLFLQNPLEKILFLVVMIGGLQLILRRRSLPQLFAMSSVPLLALSGSWGFIIGFLPLDGLRLITAIITVLFFNLNLPALLLGLGLALITPLGYAWLVNGIKIAQGAAQVSPLGMQLFFGLALSGVGYYPTKLFYGWLLQKLNVRIDPERSPVGKQVLRVLGLRSFWLLTSVTAAGLIVYSIGQQLGQLVKTQTDPYPLLLLLTGQLGPDGFALGIKGIYSLFIPVLVVGLLAINLFGALQFFFAPLNKAEGRRGQHQYVFNDLSGVRWLGVKKFTCAYLIIGGLALVAFGLAWFLDWRLSVRGESNPAELGQSPGLSQNAVKAEGRSGKEVYGFYVNWDRSSKQSLRRNIHLMDTVIPNWFTLNPNLEVTFRHESLVDQLAKEHGVKIIPLINNFSGGKWDKALVHRLLISEAEQQRLINTVVGELKRQDYAGLNLDFEYLDAGDRGRFTQFVLRLKTVLAKEGLKLILDVEANSPAYDYRKLAAYADQIIVMLYDEHTEVGKAGAIASWQWFTGAFNRLRVPTGKVVVGLASYGYDWADGKTKHKGESITCDEVLRRAREYHGKFKWDSTVKSPNLVYYKRGVRHTVWFNDATVFYNQCKYLHSKRVKGIALWRLGSEDQQLWKIVEQFATPEKGIAALKTFSVTTSMVRQGKGEVLLLDQPAKVVKRLLTLDRKGIITKARYQGYAAPRKVTLTGGSDVKKLALTFDDGPDPNVTPLILDILKQYGVKATFFMVGENIVRHSELLKRVAAEGHEIGNHTYSHLDFTKHSPEVILRELRQTEQVIGSNTGKRTAYYRQPYNVDTIPQQISNIGIFRMASQAGYSLVGSQIDPRDWENPDPDLLVQRIHQQLKRGQIVLLHDIGDRSNTIRALPQIIKSLKAEGYRFTTVSGLQAQPPVFGSAAVDLYKMAIFKIEAAALDGLILIQKFLAQLFLFGTIVGMVRFVFLICFATIQKRRQASLPKSAAVIGPLVTVVVAAYNEEKVICKTVDSILESDYPHLEVMVVNDGSTDATARIVSHTYAHNPRVKLVNKANGGKASAVNAGFRAAAGEIVVVLDADTLLANDAISLLARHFEAENVAAVAGNVKVGNVNNLITLWQHIEYVTGLNLERRAFDELNCITVVPGAIGAWRKKVVAEAGYYSEDTLAEDADITISVLKRGHKIVYEEGAIAYTEAPEDLTGFLKQRLRWAYGTLQCLWKHKDALFNPAHKSLGFLAMPNMWLYQFIFATIAPVTDILFVASMFGKHRLEMIGLYFFYFALDFIVTYYAFSLEGEKKQPLIWLFLQRIVYRNMITYVVYKSATAALRGVKVGWNKLKRTGTASNQAPAA